MRQEPRYQMWRAAIVALGATAALAGSAIPAHAAVRADFDDDGFEDLAIGIEGEDLPAPDDVLNAGAVTVIYGSNSDGLNPEGPPADQFWHEEVDGVRGTGDGDDGFGSAVAAGDFDGDGRSDLAIGGDGQQVRGESYAGSIRVLYGANGGLTADGDDLFTEASRGVPGNPAENDELGRHLAAGDFDGDGEDDLAATVGCQRVEGEECAGAIVVLEGSPQGLRANGAKLFSEATSGIAGSPGAFDEFGTSLAAGDLNRPGPDDLAVGIPFDDVGTVPAGTVRVLFGTPNGLTSKGDRRIHAGQGTIAGNPENNDQFGASVAAGRISGGPDELAIGTPNDADVSGGTVTVLYGRNTGPDVEGAQFWSQASADVLGTSAAGEDFGASLAFGNFDGEMRDDLAIGVPDEGEDGVVTAGAVNVLYSDGSSLTAAGDQRIHQGAVLVDGTPEASDHMGTALASGDFDEVAGDDLAVAIANETAGATDNAGAVQAFYATTPSGLSATTDELFHQGLPEIQNEPTVNEFFGYSLAAGW